jgi:hypothetical protein
MVLEFFQNGWFCQFRVYRVKPKPKPQLSGTEILGNAFSGQKSGSNFQYPNFQLPELPDLKNLGNPNAQP